MDGGDGIGAKRAEGLAVVLLVTGEEGVPAVVDELPEGRGARAAGLVDRGHKLFIRTVYYPIGKPPALPGRLSEFDLYRSLP